MKQKLECPICGYECEELTKTYLDELAITSLACKNCIHDLCVTEEDEQEPTRWEMNNNQFDATFDKYDR